MSEMPGAGRGVLKQSKRFAWAAITTATGLVTNTVFPHGVLMGSRIGLLLQFESKVTGGKTSPVLIRVWPPTSRPRRGPICAAGAVLTCYLELIFLPRVDC